jgi:phosphoenolpyruvate synthase/pyruvate phosphate dikinase
MKIEKVLEELGKLLDRWGIKSSDWIFITEYAYRLLGYDVKVRKGHLNILVKRSKIPWKVGEGLEIHPIRGTKFEKQYKKFINKTGFDFDITPLFDQEFRNKKGKFVSYLLPNGKKMQVQTPIGAVEELEKLLSMSTDKGLGQDRGIKVLEFVEDQLQAFIKKGEIENVTVYKKLLDKYKHFKKKSSVPMNVSKIDKIKGIVASKGVVKGKVRVILDPEKQRVFKRGEILVTTMTSPKFTVYLMKAAAILTDEGGMLCHAAIVAREMGIPCIVGTKIATKVFKDGDLVEVNASKGIVNKQYP